MPELLDLLELRLLCAAVLGIELLWALCPCGLPVFLWGKRPRLDCAELHEPCSKGRRYILLSSHTLCCTYLQPPCGTSQIA